MRLQEIVASIQDYIPGVDAEPLRKAYAFVRHHHQGQTRASGEPYVTHVTEVAYLATKLRLDLDSVLTALLHDTVEDTDATINNIREEFGEPVAKLVDGVTKLSKVNFQSRAEQQAENFRKMLLAMASDIRVLLIKLCDRTHNMRTLEFLSESRRIRIAQETLDIYAPLAHRLGINWMKSELEDLSFRHLKPDVYAMIKDRVAQKKKERDKYIASVVKLIERELTDNGITGDVSGRSKHFYSIYRKMETQGLDFDEIYDLIAFRVIVPTTMDCYSALGVVHAAWKPIPGRFKDYIAMPKPNSYQSLHTTVIGPQGTRVEIQIRTPEMHDVAERGIASHWVYKEKGEGAEASNAQLQLAWLKDLVESEKNLTDPHEFLAMVKGDLFPEEVFVFSPRGDVIALKYGATPVDFAFHIHSEVGRNCAGARVNGQQVPLSYKLSNGDTVEIQTNKQQKPSKDWLEFAVTSKAQQRIRAYLRSEEREKSIAVGREVLSKDLRKVGENLNKLIKSGKLQEVGESLGLRDEEALFAEIGYGKLTSKQIIRKVCPQVSAIDEKLAREQTTMERIFSSAARVFRDRSGIKVNGLDDVVFRFAKCCEPLPGDELVGYITRGRGIAIHKRGCPQTLSFDPQRLISVDWDSDAKTQRMIRLRVLSTDRVGMLADMSQSISATGANMVTVHASATPDGKAMNTFEISVESTDQLSSIIRALEKLDGVIRVERASDHRGGRY
ncbi:MAG: bifunctional (p)ppGpp synthetase/guanosine-3',5'-bis(diphosphate) 3'-pyrophosphohydrolase [Bdellovibrionales bacterium]|nr:bifunctional (p)ppGpp synthetase/guanosine-3',5'-bis(diphosphate) 3'-pyrophosphohydrolase [Bdellovibrionales bacterium]